jgi:segregation and condensation protein A
VDNLPLENDFLAPKWLIFILSQVPMTQDNTTYTIHLPQFEGPFDLLLFFIERDELDIHDIPIAKITDDFLGYIRHMERMNIDLASEFILVAATLCRIKAKLLIPRKPVDEEGNEIDPREELVLRLLEYKRYKSVLDELRELEESRSFRNYRGNASKELRKLANVALVDAELESLNLFKLLRAFERVMQRYEDKEARKTVHTVMRYSYTIADQQEYIFSRIQPKKPAKFEDLFGKLENRMHAIVTFLALLEMLNLQLLVMTQRLGTNNFWIELPSPQSDEEE